MFEMIKKAKLLNYILLLIFSISTLPLYAQPGDPPDVPIDGAIGLLIAGGAYLGVRKLQKFRKKGD